MPTILETIIGKVIQLFESIFPKKINEHETRKKELKRQEFFERDEFEQRSYAREEERTDTMGRAREKPKKVW